MELFGRKLYKFSVYSKKQRFLREKWIVQDVKGKLDVLFRGISELHFFVFTDV